MIISKLLNREPGPELLQIAERTGLKVFPRQWNDFKMDCSFPDYVVPCRHLAAVIYKISAEIDNNPFLVFSLHRLNLMEELKKERIFITETCNEIPTLKSVLLPETAAIKTNTGKRVKENKTPATKVPHALPVPAIGSKESLNYTTLSPIHEALIQLVANAPAFYRGSNNFRKKQV